MMLTVKDILTEEAFRTAEIRAGENRLGRCVFGVSESSKNCRPGTLLIWNGFVSKLPQVLCDSPYLSAVCIPSSLAYQGEENAIPVIAVQDPRKAASSLDFSGPTLVEETVKPLLSAGLHEPKEILNAFHEASGYAYYLIKAEGSEPLASSSFISQRALAKLRKIWEKNGLIPFLLEGESCFLLSEDPAFDVYRLKCQAVSLLAAVSAKRDDPAPAIASLLMAGERKAAEAAAEQMGFLLPEEHDTWVFLGEQGANMKPWMRSIREFCSSFGKIYLLEEVNHNLLLILEKANSLRNELRNADSLADYCVRTSIPAALIRANDSTGHLGYLSEVCALAEMTLPYLKKVFPSLPYYSVPEIRMVHSCRIILEENGPELQRYQEMLERLSSETEGSILAHTLGVYYLDHKMVITETASALFVHRNTIKYRIQKAEDLLGLDSGNIVDIMELVRALVIGRMI